MDTSKLSGIVKELLEKEEEIIPYFQSPQKANWCQKKNDSQLKRCVDDFKKKAQNIYHDEPWLTFMAFYGLLGNQKDVKFGIKAMNNLFKEIFSNRQDAPEPPFFEEFLEVNLEVYLPENLIYREYLKNKIFAENAYHPYLDRFKIIRDEKLSKENASLEGSTNLDALISGRNGKHSINVFIESKFLSDISKDITYVPVRNQIARNIDCAIDIVTDHGRDLRGLENFWFVLLTPGIFRTEKYGGSVRSPLAPFTPERSRLYCYKMDDYLEPSLLKRDLPHWDGILEDKHWKQVSERIGWLTFEEIVKNVIAHQTLREGLLDSFKEFFQERALS